MPAVVRDMTTVYKLGGGSGFLTSFDAWCAECPWSAGAFSGGGGGSPTPWVTNEEARGHAQRWVDRHNQERHPDALIPPPQKRRRR